MSWGYRITVLYLSFVCFMLGMVYMCIKQTDIFLVDKEYYKEEMHFQDKINKRAALAALKAPVTYSNQDGFLTIAYPEGAQPSGGDLWLFRPSNANLDRHIPAIAEAGVQRVALASMAPGLWRVKLDWQSQGRHYFSEEVVNVPSKP